MATPDDNKAHRYNAGKNQLNLIPPQFIEQLGALFTAGAQKYAANNWKKSINTDDHDAFVEDRIGSAMRHLNEYRAQKAMGNDMPMDLETGVSHATAVAWNLLVCDFYDLQRASKIAEMQQQVMF